MKNKIRNSQRNHREVGKEHDLFSFHEFGVGFPFFHDSGLKIKNKLIQKWRNLHQEDYLEIESPIMLDKSLWEKSGHLDHFSENMFFCDAPDRSYAIKPMSCPGAILHFQNKRRFHSELPLRICELGRVHRYENHGSLSGLLRVRSFVQDDAHIFCRKHQAHDEVKKILLLSRRLLKECGFMNLHYELSIRDEKDKYLGKSKDWEDSERILKDVLDDLKFQYKESYGEAKFYGPAIDVHIEDSSGKLWQCSSIQFDFNLSERFEVSYVNEKGKKEVPYILHRALFGSLERFIGILLENYGIDLPYWLKPEQVRILSFLKREDDFIKVVINQIRKLNLSYSFHFLDKGLANEIKQAQRARIDNMLIIGDKEKAKDSVSLRKLDSSQMSIKLLELESHLSCS